MSLYKFPQTKALAKFYDSIRKERKSILKGSMLSIDPATGASSVTGYALFKRGKCIENNVIPVSSYLPLHKRLKVIHEDLSNRFGDIDVLIIECLAGMKNDALKFVTGVIMISIDYQELIFLKPRIWHCIRPPNYNKSDKDDARLIGQAAIEIAKEM